MLQELANPLRFDSHAAELEAMPGSLHCRREEEHSQKPSMGIECGRGAEELKLKIAMVTDESGNERGRGGGDLPACALACGGGGGVVGQPMYGARARLRACGDHSPSILPSPSARCTYTCSTLPSCAGKKKIFATLRAPRPAATSIAGRQRQTLSGAAAGRPE